MPRRVFVAVAAPAPLPPALTARFPVVAPEHQHITLSFVGALPDADVAALRAALAATAPPPRFSLAFDDFSAAGLPYSVWATFAASPPLEALRAEVLAATARWASPASVSATLAPHITVLRVKQDAADEADALIAAGRAEQLAFQIPVTEFQLLESVGGGAYRVLDSYPLPFAFSYAEASLHVRAMVSSTFVDFFAEREALVKRVFPEIKKRFREAGATFVEVDLRVGITADQAKQGRVVSICLSEVERSSLILALCGSRWGWVPPLSPALLREYPFLSDFASAETPPAAPTAPTAQRASHTPLPSSAADPSLLTSTVSITELEIRYALRRSIPVLTFQRPDDFEHPLNQRVVENEHAHAQQAKLKAELADRGAHRYATIEELNELVARSLDDHLQAQLAGLPAGRRSRHSAHEAFAAARVSPDLEFPEFARIAASVDAQLETDGAPPLVVTAPSGAGKSTILANWVARHRAEHPATLVLAHYIDSSSIARSWKDIAAHFVDDIERHVGVRLEPSGTGSDALLRAFQDTLLAVVDRGVRLVLVFDSLESLDAESADLAWLPATLGAGIAVVVSARSDMAVLQTRGWGDATLHVQPLSEQQSRAFVGAQLAKHGKSLSVEQMDVVVQSGMASSPLYLSLLVQEVRVHGIFETLDKRLALLAAAADIASMMCEIVQRIVDDGGREQVGLIMGLVAVSRAGLAEENLQVLLAQEGFARDEWAVAMLGLEPFLAVRAGVINFYHIVVRAVAQRLFGDDFFVRCRQQLAAKPRDREVAPDDAREMLHQLTALGDYAALEAAIVDNDDVFLQLRRVGGLDLFDLSLLLGRHDRNLAGALFARATREGADVEPEYLAELGHFLSDLGQWSDCITVLKLALGKASGRSRSLVLLHLASAYKETGELGDAEATATQAVESVAGSGGSRLLEASIRNALGAILRLRDKTEEARACLMAALSLRRAEAPRSAGVAESLNSLAILLKRTGREAEARAMFDEAISIYERLYGPQYPIISRPLTNIASMWKTGFLPKPEAETLYRRAIAIQERALGPSHSDLGFTLFQMGVMLGDRAALERSLAIRKVAFGPEHRITLDSQAALDKLDGEGAK